MKKKQLRRKKRAKEKKQTKKDEQDPEDDEEEIRLVDLFTPHLVVRASGKIRSFDFRGGASLKGVLQVSKLC